MMDSSAPKWTEIEHLPEWDEEFYHVYTAKKYGKWLMLKTLRPELKGQEEYDKMIEKEFEVRYNLAHPHIIMINDFEEVPGLGMCIITDDVYGDSLRKLLDKGEVTPEIKETLVYRLADAIGYIQQNHIIHHPIRPETIIFTEKIRNLKVIDVGFDQRAHLSPTAAAEDIRSYGMILKEVLDKTDDHNQHLRRIAERCLHPDPRKRFRDVPDLKMALSGRSNKRLYMLIISFLLLMTLILGYLSFKNPTL